MPSHEPSGTEGCSYLGWVSSFVLWASLGLLPSCARCSPLWTPVQPPFCLALPCSPFSWVLVCGLLFPPAAPVVPSFLSPLAPPLLPPLPSPCGVVPVPPCGSPPWCRPPLFGAPPWFGPPPSGSSSPPLARWPAASRQALLAPAPLAGVGDVQQPPRS